MNSTGYIALSMNVSGATGAVGLQIFTDCGVPQGFCNANVAALSQPFILNLAQGQYFLRFFTTPSAQSNFTICATGLLPGYECNGAVNITSVPVTNQVLVCSGAALPGLLNATSVPDVCGAAANTYKGGQEALYTFSPSTTGNYQVSIAGQTKTAIFVYANACPTNAGVCVGSIGTTASTKSLVVPMSVGTIYYIWFDTNPTPNSPCPGTFSLVLLPPPPANDVCAGAYPLTVNPTSICTMVTAGTVQSATASTNPVVCTGGAADDDVWFTFVATNTTHYISLTNVVGSVTDMYHAVYSGTCGAFTNLLCSDPDNSVATGLIVGNTYYVRVYTYTAVSNQNTTFNVCITSPPVCPAGLGVNSVTVTSLPYLTTAQTTCGSGNNVTSTNVVSVCGSTNYYSAEDRTYIFTPTTTGVHTILLTTSTDDDAGIQLYQGCPFTAGSTCVANAQSTIGPGR